MGGPRHGFSRSSSASSSDRRDVARFGGRRGAGPLLVHRHPHHMVEEDRFELRAGGNGLGAIRDRLDVVGGNQFTRPNERQEGLQLARVALVVGIEEESVVAVWAAAILPARVRRNSGVGFEAPSWTICEKILGAPPLSRCFHKPGRRAALPLRPPRSASTRFLMWSIKGKGYVMKPRGTFVAALSTAILCACTEFAQAAAMSTSGRTSGARRRSWTI
jgi:hypothetical protein